MSREDPQFNFRMTPEIKEKVKQRAKLNGRSINAELLQIVQDALDKPFASDWLSRRRRAPLQTSRQSSLKRLCLIRLKTSTARSHRWNGS